LLIENNDFYRGSKHSKLFKKYGEVFPKYLKVYYIKNCSEITGPNLSTNILFWNQAWKLTLLKTKSGIKIISDTKYSFSGTKFSYLNSTFLRQIKYCQKDRHKFYQINVQILLNTFTKEK